MSDPLYRPALLRLAADATGAGRLAVPCATATAHNPTCADKVTVDVAVQNGRIVAMAHDTKACVLTQAAAAILGGAIAGQTRSEIVALHATVIEMLAGSGPPSAPFDAFAVFVGVGQLRPRHKCVLLPIEAVLAALAQLEAGKMGGERP